MSDMENYYLFENRVVLDSEYKKGVDKFSSFQSVMEDNRTMIDINRRIFEVCVPKYKNIILM